MASYLAIEQYCWGLSNLLSIADGPGPQPSSPAAPSQAPQTHWREEGLKEGAQLHVQPRASACLTNHQNDFAGASFIKMEAQPSSMQMGPLYYFLICLQKACIWCTPSLQIVTNGHVCCLQSCVSLDKWTETVFEHCTWLLLIASDMLLRLCGRLEGGPEVCVWGVCCVCVACDVYVL